MWHCAKALYNKISVTSEGFVSGRLQMAREAQASISGCALGFFVEFVDVQSHDARWLPQEQRIERKARMKKRL